MTSKNFLRAVWALPLIVLCQAAGAAYIQLDFTGTLTNIVVQTGSGVYGGVTAGSSLGGSVRYGVSAGDAAWVDSNPVEQEWGFVGPEYGASYNVDGVVLGASDSKLSINNDLALSQAYVDVLTAAGISAVVGQTVWHADHAWFAPPCSVSYRRLPTARWHAGCRIKSADSTSK